MATAFSDQVLKPTNAAKRLGVYLPATPPEFQESGTTRGALEEMESNPPQWLETLRRDGPHPRQVVAARLDVSISGLARGGVEEALTTAEIDALRDDPPAWLIHERERAAKVREQEELVRVASAKRAKARKEGGGSAAAPRPARGHQDSYRGASGRSGGGIGGTRNVPRRSGKG